MTKAIVEEYLCAECGTTTPVPNETCPNCGGPMTSLGQEEKPKTDEDSETPGNDDSLAGVTDDGSDGTPLSLEALQEEEGEDDRKEYEEDNFGNE